MKRFDQIQYERPDYAKLTELMQQTIDIIKNASDAGEVERAVHVFDRAHKHCETMAMVALIRCYLDGTDKFYAEEMAYAVGQEESFDASPLFETIAHSPYRSAFEAKYGHFILRSMEKQQTLHAAGGELIAKRQEIIAEHHRFQADMTYGYEGETVSGSKISMLKKSDDPTIRKKARHAERKAYADSSEKHGEFLDRMVKVQNALAKANGYSDYLEYCNTEMQRYTYGEAEFDLFCANVKKYFLPLIEKNNQRIRERLHLNELTTEDTGVYFPDGNAVPLGDESFVRARTQEMFDDLDPVFGAFYRQMNENGYIDIALSDNKVTNMGFRTGIHDEGIPFVFGNYLSDDTSVTTFLHELGHSAQAVLSAKRFDLLELEEMAQDLSELPSKTMELFSHRYARLFFGDDAEKYIQKHLSVFMSEIADFCSIHEFETFLFRNPHATQQERIDKFNELTRIYSPGIVFTDEELRSKGSALYGNIIFYIATRYVITYSLSSLSAIYLAAEFKKDKANGIELYKKLCEIGGSLDYNEAITYIGLKPAYTEEIVKEVAEYLKAELHLD